MALVLLRFLHAVLGVVAEELRIEARTLAMRVWSAFPPADLSSLSLLFQAEKIDRERAWIAAIFAEQLEAPPPAAWLAVSQRMRVVFYRGRRVELSPQNRALFRLLVERVGHVVDIDVITQSLVHEGLLGGEEAPRPTDLRKRLVKNFKAMLPASLHDEIGAMIQTRQGLRLALSASEIVMPAARAG